MFILNRVGAVVVATALLALLLSPAAISAAEGDGQADVGEVGYTQNARLPLSVAIDGDTITCFCVDYYGDLAELGAGYEVVSHSAVAHQWFSGGDSSPIAAALAAQGDYSDSNIQRVIWHYTNGFSLRNDAQRELRDRIESGFYTPLDIVLMAPLDEADQPMACEDPTPPPPTTTATTTTTTTTTAAPSTTTTAAPTTTTTAPATTTTAPTTTTTAPPTTTIVIQATSTTTVPLTTTTTTTVAPTTTTTTTTTTTLQCRKQRQKRLKFKGREGARE